MKIAMSSNDEEMKCPLCTEDMDRMDQQFKPCDQCGYQACLFCWKKISEKNERCPGCRGTVDVKEKSMAPMEAKCESEISNRKASPHKAKGKANEVKKDLTSVRVIQRKAVFVSGLPLRLADKNLLEGNKYFGQYGENTEVSLFQKTGGRGLMIFPNNTCSAHVKYSTEEEAANCIRSVNGFNLDGRMLRASFGTIKYCHSWLKTKPCTYSLYSGSPCRYLHTMATDKDTLEKDDDVAVKTRSIIEEILGAANTGLGNRSGSVFPPSVVKSRSTSQDSTSSQMPLLQTTSMQHGSSSRGNRSSGHSGTPPNQD